MFLMSRKPTTLHNNIRTLYIKQELQFISRKPILWALIMDSSTCNRFLLEIIKQDIWHKVDIYSNVQ